MAKKKDEEKEVVVLEEIEFKKADFVIGGQRNFNLDMAMRLWKTKWGDDENGFKVFHRNVIKHPIMEPMGNYVKEFWNDINPISVEEAFKEKNMEVRRVYFDCIGVEKLFRSLEPKLLDKQTLRKKRARWDEKNKERMTEYNDIYELYQIDGNKLFQEDGNRSNVLSVFAVHCVCPSTDREYWIYVPQEAAIGTSAGSNSKGKPNAVAAIAWTIMLNISNPKRILRQGDIIIAEYSEDSKEVPSYHISEEQYLKLMYSET